MIFTPGLSFSASLTFSRFSALVATTLLEIVSLGQASSTDILSIVHLEHPGELGGGVGVVDGGDHEVGGRPSQDEDGVLDTVGESNAEDIAWTEA